MSTNVTAGPEKTVLRTFLLRFILVFFSFFEEARPLLSDVDVPCCEINRNFIPVWTHGDSVRRLFTQLPPCFIKGG